MVYYMGTYSGYSLQHHGIKGQKWGIRRYQNPDGSLTAAGKKRYDTKQARELVRTARKEYKQVLKRHQDEGIINWHKNSDVVKSFGKLQNEKKNFALIKAREKKDTKRLKYEEHYRQKGLSPEEAEIAAYKRQRTQKILAVTAGVAITAAAAYVAYKHYDRNVDKFIKEGTIYKRVARTPDTSVHDAFFASTGKKDPIKYKGYWGSTIEGFDGGFGGVFGGVYSKDIVVDKGIKVASEKSARNVFSGLMRSDPEFRTNFKNVLDHEYQNIDRMKKGSYKKALREAKKAFESNNYDNKYLYRVMNANIPSLDGEHGAKRFYSELRKRGFGALEDLNDRWYSGYDTRTAKIFIDKGRVHVDNVHRMFSKELEANFKAARKIDSQSVKERTKDLIFLLESSAPLLPGLSIVGAASAYSNKKQSQASKSKETQVIRDYRKDHPNSKLSDDDILRNYYG